jgi:putative spermidine/putrescine transport system ATP-binding protein/spermidine/putrescine transport system ATP-binding protein
MENAVELRDIVKRFGSFTAVHRMSLDIEQGSFLTLLGPSGCGKTTTLRMIAGLIDATEGDITIKGKRVNNLPIHKRNLGIVFQNYALFPHKTINENVAFGLKYRGVGGDEAERRVRDALELVQLPQMGDRYPRQLSGGQQQRIALARAIVIEPDVLLLDEPLSALDANLREDMRVELKRIQDKLGITTVFVTHDQGEALAMSDKIVVMRGGKIEQVGEPQAVYDAPESEFVAEFLGSTNILGGRVSGRQGEGITVDATPFEGVEVPADRAGYTNGATDIKLLLRAEKLLVEPGGSADGGGIAAPAVVETVDYQGQSVRYFLRIGDRRLQAINMVNGKPFAEGETVTARFDPRHCSLLPAQPGDAQA